jgi:hypothetical protein
MTWTSWKGFVLVRAEQNGQVLSSLFHCRGTHEALQALGEEEKARTRSPAEKGNEACADERLGDDSERLDTGHRLIDDGPAR